MSKPVYFKLFVKDRGEPTINTLEYIATNIATINQMGVRVSITKINADEIDQALLKKLRARHINSFPTLITDNGSMFVGYKKIRALFEKNKTRFATQADGPRATPRGDFGNNPDLAEFYASEMSLSAIERDKSNGRNGDEMGGGLDDRALNNVMSAQMAKRRITSGNDRQMEAPQTRGRTDPEDNIRHPEDEILLSKSPTIQQPPPKPTAEPKRGGNSVDDMFDQRFMEGAHDDY